MQTPVLCLIHQREEEIRNFKPKTFYQVIATFNVNGMQYVGAMLHEDEVKLFNYEQVKSWYEQCRTVKEANINSVLSEQKENNAPKLHSLSSLQAKLNRKYKLSPEDVLKLLKVYMRGVILAIHVPAVNI